jgi:hypothetical protein
MSNLKKHLSDYVALLSLLISLLSGIIFIMNIDKTNAIQETQITNITARLDRIEQKIDQLKS